MPSSTASSSTSRPTIFGLFDRPTTPERDLEAQTPIAAPSPARTNASRTRRSSEDPVDPVATFFGVSHTRSRTSLSLAGTRDSRHDESRQATLVEPEALPPSYEDSLEPPAYTQVSGQPTLAMYLFKFGFCEYSERRHRLYSDSDLLSS